MQQLPFINDKTTQPNPGNSSTWWYNCMHKTRNNKKEPVQIQVVTSPVALAPFSLIKLPTIHLHLRILKIIRQIKKFD